MFHDRLNEYITQLGCSGRELAEASGLSPVTVSRYRSGERRPESEAERAKLVSGIARLAESRGIVTGYGDGSFRPGTSATPMRNTAGMPRRPRPSPLPAAATPSAPATRPSATSPLPSGPESGRWSPKTAPPPSTLSSDIPSCGAPLRHSCADNTVFSETLPYRKKNTPLFRSGEKREMQGR